MLELNVPAAGRTHRLLRAGRCIVAVLVVGTGTAVPLFFATARPRSWGSVEAPLPANAWGPGGAHLGLAVCPAVRACWAIGSYYVTVNQNAGNGEILVDRLSQGDWHATEAPLPANAGPTPLSEAAGLACPSSTWCVAVGSYQTALNANVALPLIDTFRRGSWAALEPPFPGAGAALTSVSCSGAGACAAIGATALAGTAPAGFVEILANGVWKATAAPSPSGGPSTLEALACPAAGSCVVLGDYRPAIGELDPLVGTLSGRNWSVERLPLPPDAATGGGAGFSAISCPAAGTCVAVGSYVTSGGGFAALIESLSNGTWTATKVPEPPNSNGTSASLNGVACTSTSTCTAVGSYRTAESNGLPMVDALVNGKWTAIEAPLPGVTGTGTRANLEALSCVHPDACVAAGYVLPMNTGNTSASEGLIESGISGSWVPSAAPQPASGPGGGPSAQLGGVSCPSSSYCVAVADYTAATGVGEGEVVSTPTLVLSPSSTATGATVKASLSGFAGTQPVQLTWKTLSGTVLAQAVTDASGKATATFLVPSVGAGKYRVVAASSGGTIAWATLVVS